MNKKAKTTSVLNQFDFASLSLGKTMLAMQGQAVVWISVGDSESELLAAAKARGHEMRQNKNNASISKAFKQLQKLIDHPMAKWTLPLDLQGTEFQKQVWSAIAEIPAGKTVTYQQLATSIGRKSSVRAVASACGANPVAIVVPCHRVLRSDGGLGGYRWGVERKKKLLAREVQLHLKTT